MSAVPVFEGASELARDESLPGLSQVESLTALHLDDAVRAFGAVALSTVVLPPLSASALVPAQIRIFGALYWCYELEQAGLVPFIEGLAEEIVRGTVLAPLGSSVQDLASFWSHREFHFRKAERQALFHRMFEDGGADGSVLSTLRTFAESLGAIGHAGPMESTEHLEVRAGVQARELGLTATARGAGIAAFAARDIIGQVRLAWNLLRDPDLVLALNGGSPWLILERHGRRFVGRELSPSRPVDRAQAGLALFKWIADEAAGLEAGRARIPRSSPVVHAALAWSAAADRV